MDYFKERFFLTVKTFSVLIVALISIKAIAQAPKLKGNLLYHGYSGYDNWDSEMFILDLADSSVVNISSEWNIDHEMNGVFSPDGKKIAFMGDEKGGGRNWDIFLWAIGEKEPTNLTAGSSAREEDPKFSPDGSKIIFKVNGDIKEMDLSGNIIHVVTNTPDIEESMPYYSTDGNTIVFMQNAHEKADIYSCQLDGAGRTPLANIPNVHEYYPITRDDTTFFYTSWVSESDYHDQLYLGFFDASKTIKLPFNNINADYSDATPVGAEYVILSSTRNGGKGGYDLYIADIYNGDIWSIDDYNISVNTNIEELGSNYFAGNIPVIDSATVLKVGFPKNNSILDISEEVYVDFKINNSNVSILKVELYSNDKLIGTDTIDPFSFSLESAEIGLNSIYGIAYDVSGAKFHSVDVDLLLTNQLSERTKVMVVGNSISQESPGYRGTLFDSLFYNGYRVDFVGRKHDMGMKDGDHSGYSGFVIGPDRHMWYENDNIHYIIKDDIMNNTPDIITLLIGINDFWNLESSNPYDPRVDGAIRLDALVDTIFKQDPDVTLLLSTLLPLANGSNEIDLFNSQVPEISSKYKALGFNCILVDMYKNCGFETGDWVDNIHPSQSGYNKMANVWFNKLDSVLTDKGINAFFSMDKNADDYLKLTFNASESQGEIESYYWVIDDNEVLSGEIVDYTFSDLGEHEIKLIIVSNGITDSIVKNVKLGHSIPGKIEAEHYNDMSGVAIETCYDDGGGLDVGGIFQGDWMLYAIDVEKSGYYTITYRLATPDNNGAIQVVIDDSVMATTTVPNTGGWQEWGSVSDIIFISKGMHILKVIAPSNRSWNLNWLDLRYYGENPPVGIENKTGKINDVLIYPNPAGEYFYFKGSSSGKELVVSLFTIKGDLVFKKKAGANELVDISMLKQGIYFVKVDNTIKKLVKIN